MKNEFEVTHVFQTQWGKNDFHSEQKINYMDTEITIMTFT